MAKWYWKNYRQRDNVASFAGLWDRWGLLLSMCLIFFLLAGLGTFFGALAYCQGLADQVSAPLVLAMLSGSSLAMAGVFYGGIAAASIAHTTNRRMRMLEERIRRLEEPSEGAGTN